MSLIALLFSSATALGAQPTTRPTDEVRGEELYRRHCVACHGTRNNGDGPVASAMVAPVPDLQGNVQTTDDAARMVLRGVNAMPGYEATFDRHDAVRVLKYMASLGPDKELPENPTPATRKPPKKKKK